MFNPANFGIIISLLILPAWISQGQWGHFSELFFLFTMLGVVVTQRARVGWVSIQFLFIFFLLMFSRNLWLGFEQHVTLHAMLNGALLIFAFFMISDPKTNPQSSTGRFLHILWTVICFGILQFEFSIQNALFWSLFISAPLTPFWDQATQYQKKKFI